MPASWQLSIVMCIVGVCSPVDLTTAHKGLGWSGLTNLLYSILLQLETSDLAIAVSPIICMLLLKYNNLSTIRVLLIGSDCLCLLQTCFQTTRGSPRTR